MEGPRTYKERKGFLEFRDLLFGKRVGLRTESASAMAVEGSSNSFNRRLLTMAGLRG